MSRFLFIATLVIAGEMVFGLPFHTARFFRPTLLEVFGFSNTELGDLFAVFGVTAMLSYFPGGALADRYEARSLMSVALIATGAGGLYMAMIPGPLGMGILYGYWGITTGFLFWGALIRATRMWGGQRSQGKAFGILEGGRGLAAFAVAGVTVLVFASLMPADAALATDAERRSSFQIVLVLYSMLTMLLGLLTWSVIPAAGEEARSQSNPLTGMATVLRRPIVWAQAAVIVCAYCGYKGLDYYSDYAVRVLGMNEVDAAKFATWGALIRPFAAIGAGFIADRFDASRTIGVTFAVMLAAFAALSLLAPAGGLTMIYANVFVSFVAVFALRGVYFALLEDYRTPAYLTGAAVGMISLLGYTPEIFFAPIAGRIIDANPGLLGYQHFFVFLAAIGALGVLVVFVLIRMARPGRELWPTASKSRPIA
ncbi:MAG: MFS transporter [Pseudomonadota bacterium]